MCTASQVIHPAAAFIRYSSPVRHGRLIKDECAAHVAGFLCVCAVQHRAVGTWQVPAMHSAVSRGARQLTGSQEQVGVCRGRRAG